jgi:histone H2A
MSFKPYIQIVLKQVHPDTAINSSALNMVNSMAEIIAKKVMSNANRMALHSELKTISSREIQSAIRVCLPGELGKHAVSEGVKAVTKFVSAGIRDPNAKKLASGKKAPVLAQTKAGIQFSVSRVRNLMEKMSMCSRIGSGAPVYLAATMEYIVAEILELAGNSARDNKRTRITPRDIKLTVLNDEELAILSNDIFMNGGVLPNIHTVLLPREKPKKKKSNQ